MPDKLGASQGRRRLYQSLYGGLWSGEVTFLVANLQDIAIKRCAVRLASMDAAVARNIEHVTGHVTSTRPSIVGSCLGACRGPVPPHPFQGRLDAFIMHIEASPLRAPETASPRRVRERSACWR